MDFIQVSAKTVSDAITEACQKLMVSSEKLEYEVVEEGSSGFLGIGAKPAIIKARVKNTIEDIAKNFLDEVFRAMNLEVVIDLKYNEAARTMDIDLSGSEMGVLIGKRGQTLDSLQYLVSLVVNKDVEDYIRVKETLPDWECLLFYEKFKNLPYNSIKFNPSIESTPHKDFLLIAASFRTCQGS